MALSYSIPLCIDYEIHASQNKVALLPIPLVNNLENILNIRNILRGFLGMFEQNLATLLSFQFLQRKHKSIEESAEKVRGLPLTEWRIFLVYRGQWSPKIIRVANVKFNSQGR